MSPLNMSLSPLHRRSWPTGSWSAAAVIATVAAFGVVGTGLGNSERLVAASFATALKTSGAPPLAATATTHSELAHLSGSEEFWLGAGPAVGALKTEPVTWTGALRTGDRLTITSSGRERRLEVVDIHPVGEAAAAHGGQPLLLVTCRDTASPDAVPVRFVIEKDEGTAASGRGPRAL